MYLKFKGSANKVKTKADKVLERYDSVLPEKKKKHTIN